MNGAEIGEMLIGILSLIQLGLFGFGLYDLITRKRVKGGSKLLWGLLIVVVGIIGPIIYLVIGRKRI